MVKNNNLNISIDLMTYDDLLILKETLVTEFDEFWNYSILEQELKNENTTYIVAKESNEIVGFAGILVVLDEATIMNIVTKNAAIIKFLLFLYFLFIDTKSIFPPFIELVS